MKLHAAFQIAIIQLNSQEDKETNLQNSLSFIDEACAAGAGMVCLPEYFNFLGRDELKLAAAEEIPGPTISLLQEKARQRAVWIHGGSILEKGAPGGKCWNTSVLINSAGEMVAKYRKIHLFDVKIPGQVELMESATICPGDCVVTADTAYGRLGFSICYDLRFAELYRALSEAATELVMVPAAFTLQTGKDHWEVLLRARAIENQLYVVAAAQVGEHPPGQFCYGNAMIVDPWGTVIARCSEKPGWAMAKIDLAFMQQVRRNLPSLKHATGDGSPWRKIVPKADGGPSDSL